MITGLLGLYWALGGPGFPFGEHDQRAREVGSLFATAEPAGMGAATAIFGFAGVAAAAGLSRGHRPLWIRSAAWSSSAVLLLVVPDIRVIQNFAYLFFAYTGLWDRPLLYMVWSMLGGGIWAMAALTSRRERSAGDAVDVPSAAADRWLLRHRKAVTYLAAALALPYPVVRIAWGVGIPLGVPSAYIENSSLELRIGESVLGGLAVGGAALTIGLIRPWGSTFPRWIPLLGGRTVPVWAAVVPAAWAAFLIVQAGLRVLAWTVTDETSITAETWGTGAPGLFWLPWGVCLGLAAYAYAAHRRERAT